MIFAEVIKVFRGFGLKVNSKKRFALKLEDDKFYIRANQGHSIRSLEMDYKPVVPPDVLYHGTATRFLDSIMKTGINKMSRNYVQLSTDIDTATTVGSRHGTPIILKVDSRKMSDDGIKFYLSNNNVWLTEYVDTKYIEICQR